MPYIKDEDKKEMHKKEMTAAIHDLSIWIKSKGDLNYAICELIGQLILDTKISYTQISEWIDTLPDAEAELRRRILNPYEDLKIIENGDVPSFVKILEKIQPPKV
jgi:hypothetical protein